ncbi:kinase-like domain-containing protein [Dunaliella salina]|uniref:Serine/threonine-protein kinase ATR n=1 Tax=Dunaliella salina TaxID=3046 RepID=A0ABQ7FZ01_DUNSA|nr:kinase-like domain-containing protein [Dunaliella salina]|eukprot:KAF5827558.1 kinase-like domain-containing protein [Dunaliella salina]
METGFKYRLQCLPRTLTLYCEFGSELMPRNSRQQTVKERSAATKVINCMRGAMNTISPVAWLVTLPQLISRICHKQIDVSEVLQVVLLRCYQSYPQQVMWSIACLSRSSNLQRREIAQQLTVQMRRCSDAKGSQVLDNFGRLVDAIIHLTNYNPKQCPKYLSARHDFAKLYSLLPTCGVMVPVQEAFAVPLPPARLQPVAKPLGPGNSTAVTAAVPVINEDPGLVTIVSMRDAILVMTSLQKPKKLTFVGSDGMEYPFLAKPKDDLRKDYRLMDFVGVANSLFAAAVAFRRRSLKLRTYSVIVLAEDCGILQWVNNLVSFKSCCEEVYANEGMYRRRDFAMAVKKMYDSTPSKRQWLEKVMQTLPPRMHKWWLTRFSEPATWLAARLSFTRTNAAWCMLGHMLGLGDRHCENIMVDTASGDTVHVDFGCLFDRGLILEVPEMVPFRLTQNMVDAFGISGVEGSYRKCAEITLQVLRQHRSTLMTSAETFLYDPLVDWMNARRGGHVAQQEATAEYENPSAKDALATIDGRLSGTLLGVSSAPSLPLSVEGHVQRLVAEATDKDNLARMYIWWMPWF